MELNAILVRTEYSSNIGASARALANMGGDRLILIDPKCEVLDEPAKQGAAGAQDALRQATIYASWGDFFRNEGEGLRIGMTRRTGRNRKVFALDEKLRELSFAENESSPCHSPVEHFAGHVYLIFGPEADGLDQEDLAYANFACHLPTQGEFQSLNLAQAVLLSIYIAHPFFKPQKPNPEVAKNEAVQPFYFPDDLIKEWLEAMGFDVDARKASAYITLRRLFLQNLPTKHELQVLEAILHQNIRKLKATNERSDV